MLGLISTLVGRLGGNILEVHHRRTFLDVPAKGTRLDMTVETRDQADFLRQRAPDIVYQGYLFGRPEPDADWLARAAQTGPTMAANPT